jgi:predicted SAM-dependent methyltransferase
VKYIFAAHVVEHLHRHGEAPTVLRDIHRVLQPGGVFRVVVPDIEKYLRAYVAGDAQFFDDRKKTWKWAEDCKTYLEHFLTYAGAGQTLEAFGGHKYGFDFDTLALVLREAGFSKIERSEFMQSAVPELRIDDKSVNARANSNGHYYSLFVDSTK